MCVRYCQWYGWEFKKRARKAWIAQEMISKMVERRTWKNVNTEKAGRTTGA